MEYEPPRRLLGRLRLGREEFCQRLLTMLIVGGRYPKWNSRSRPCRSGEQFLASLHALSFGEEPWMDGGIFVDEFELAKRHDDEAGGAPDWAVLWPNRVWIVELKTEAASHRPAQIPSYFELARHHHPDCSVDITYLTPPLAHGLASPPPWGRFSHVTWSEIVPLLEATWKGVDDHRVAGVLEGVLEAIATIQLSPSEWRADYLRGEATDVISVDPSTAQVPDGTPLMPPAGADTPEVLEAAISLAEQTSRDGHQRAVEFAAVNLEELQQLRLEVRDAIRATPDGSPLRHVMPWLWSCASTGESLTQAGKETGYELRLSRYSREVY